MTKVELHYRVIAPLDEKHMNRIAEAHGVYGLVLVRLSPSLDALDVVYDASRLTREDVDATLARMGLPVRREPQ
jgi:hypothetical protein